MGKAPAFQFYVDDWLSDHNLRRCSLAAQGIWISVLCMMFKSERPGVLITDGRAWSEGDLICALGGNQDVVRLGIQELLRTGTMRRSKRLSVMFSARMVRDRRRQVHERVRKAEQRKGHSKLSQQCPSNVPAMSRRSSSPSSSSSSESPSEIYIAAPPKFTPAISEDDHAVVALSRWAESSRGYALNPARGEYEAVGRFLVSMAAEPPIVHGGVSTARGLLIPKAADIHREKGTPFKSIVWALVCVQNLLAEWAATGVVGQQGGKAAGPVWVDPFPKGGAV